MNTEQIAALLEEHSTVNSSTNWIGSPGNYPKYIHRHCKCRTPIGSYPFPTKGGVTFSLSGDAFDKFHREHIAQVLSAAVGEAMNELAEQLY